MPAAPSSPLPKPREHQQPGTTQPAAQRRTPEGAAQASGAVGQWFESTIRAARPSNKLPIALQGDNVSVAADGDEIPSRHCV